MAPQTQLEWRVAGKDGFESLKANTEAPIPKVGSSDVLVKFSAASLNYRDLIIPMGKYPFPLKENTVAGSDGAGTVEAVGEQVTRFKVGDKVATLFNQAHLGGFVDAPALQTGLGGVIDGTLRQYGSFNEQGLVHIPSNLSFEEASTLPCAALTAWNALYGVADRPLKAGDWVLTQGTGGVSIFALQFAKAAGAKVISTTSSSEKAETLKKLGADHVINYKEVENWGEKARELTGGIGVNHVVEVGGPTTMAQSLKAVTFEGVISIIGFLGGNTKNQPTFLEVLNSICVVRGVYVGSRKQMEAMNRAIEANDIHPVVDKTTFPLEKAVDAFRYQWDQKHFGKVVVTIN